MSTSSQRIGSQAVTWMNALHALTHLMILVHVKLFWPMSLSILSLINQPIKAKITVRFVVLAFNRSNGKWPFTHGRKGENKHFGCHLLQEE
jgi:hypothetical protein